MGHSAICLPQFVHVIMWPHSRSMQSMTASMQILHRSLLATCSMSSAEIKCNTIKCKKIERKKLNSVPLPQVFDPTHHFMANLDQHMSLTISLLQARQSTASAPALQIILNHFQPGLLGLVPPPSYSTCISSPNLLLVSNSREFGVRRR